MKQLLILSGKGGTGKTTVASAFIKLLEAKAYADCDVDAPNLHLAVAQDTKPKESDFYGMDKAVINTDLCTNCGICKNNCRFDAIIVEDNQHKVDSYACEGCSVCQLVCPENAINLKPYVYGGLTLYQNNDTVFSTAQLKMGSGNSGKLVSEVKKQMTDSEIAADVAVIDGSPGIGCPVIASISGVDMTLIVTEPTLSGISDLERIIKTSEIFKVKIAVCINKYDANLEIAEKIAKLCKKLNIPQTTSIPYDTCAVDAVNDGKTIVDIDCKAGQQVKKVLSETMEILHS